MKKGFWVEESPVGVTVCDKKGMGLEMNAKSREIFARHGGGALVGADMLECHPPEARAKMRRLLATGKANVYTIEKKGRKKLIYQGPWFKAGRLGGLVELSIELPAKVPHFVR
ncbi:MAG: PAS domain-containing protein [Elusimicrobia bacterium]|nr:PAS domain-containing protein [Elusimicrobiota bacterium]